MFLEKRGYKILHRNYLRKWGELDIVARKGSKLHFVEVKSIKVSRVTLQDNPGRVPQETYRPEENLHPQKLRRLYRTIELYLLHPPKEVLGRAGEKLDMDWQLDLITAKIDLNTREARVEILENIVG